MIRRLLPLCFLAFIGSLLSSCQSPRAAPSGLADSTAMAQPSQPLQPTYTAYPTYTPYPSFTPIPTKAEPTDTLTATSYPTFTATPVPTAVASSPLTLLRWSQETRAQLDIQAEASGTVGDLLGNPMLGDATWTALLAAQVVKIREADAVLRGMVPPEECREAHEVLLSASADGLLASEYTLEWTQEQDSALGEQAGEYTRSMIAKMNLFRLMREAMTP